MQVLTTKDQIIHVMFIYHIIIYSINIIIICKEMLFDCTWSIQFLRNAVQTYFILTYKELTSITNLITYIEIVTVISFSTKHFIKELNSVFCSDIKGHLLNDSVKAKIYLSPLAVVGRGSAKSICHHWKGLSDTGGGLPVRNCWFFRFKNVSHDLYHSRTSFAQLNKKKNKLSRLL